MTDWEGPVDIIREALHHLRYSNAQPNLGAAWDMKAALAALTEVEQQLSGAEAARDTLLREISEDYVLAGAYHEQQARVVAAEKALAEANRSWALRLKYGNDCEDALEAAEQRANEQQARADDLEIRMDAEIVAHGETEAERDALADALREIADEHLSEAPMSARHFQQIARAALDRHTHQDKAVT